MYRPIKFYVRYQIESDGDLLTSWQHADITKELLRKGTCEDRGTHIRLTLENGRFYDYVVQDLEVVNES